MKRKFTEEHKKHLSESSRRITDTQLEYIKDEYVNGKSSKIIGDEIGFSNTTILKWLRKLHIEIRPARNISGWWRGRKVPKHIIEVRAMGIREYCRNNQLAMHSSESRARAGQSNRGKKRTEEQREKIREGVIRFYRCKGVVGDDEYDGFTEVLRHEVRGRDKHKCRVCAGELPELPMIKNCNGDMIRPQLDVHHIDYNKNNNAEGNLVSLCHECHSKTNYNRGYWIKYFQEEVPE